MLREAGAEHGFGVTVVEPVRGPDAAVYSSTHIRELLREGSRARRRPARPVLGDRRARSWKATGAAARSASRPSISGSANICARLRRLRGAGRRRRPRRSRSLAAGSTGSPISGCVRRLAAPRPRLEANLFDIDADLYGRHLRVALVDFIRPERRFAGIDALKAQIAEDGRHRAPDPGQEQRRVKTRARPPEFGRGALERMVLQRAPRGAR
jgi:riboflavin kinase/FMN adenylyltransferase